MLLGVPVPLSPIFCSTPCPNSARPPPHREAAGTLKSAGTQPPLSLSPPDPCCSAKGDLSDEDDDNEFFDAPEIITVPESMGHK